MAFIVKAISEWYWGK